MRKICFLTGTRAEWGLLSRLAGMVRDDSELTLQIVACNMHLSAEYGNTYTEIEAGGFTIDYRVPMVQDGDMPIDTARSVGIGTIGFAEAYAELRPDLLVILGDRYEMLAAASAALFFRIPIAHISGGDITEGAYDDAIRHAITKLSHLHFTSTEEYRNRVIQLGETPNRVFNVGAIGIDNISELPLMDRATLEATLDAFSVDRNTLLVTFHPATLDEGSPADQMQSLLDALARHLETNPKAKVLFTMPNSDTNGRIIAEMIRQWCASEGDRAVWYNSLGVVRYLSALRYVGGVVGNSSSAIVEVPSFGIPTINIGSRQRGRIAARSVINVEPNCEEIYSTLQKIRTFGDQEFENPYEQPNTAMNIFTKIKSLPLDNITTKVFYDQCK